jgi:hypothetical protein
MDKIIITATAFGVKHTIELNNDTGIEDFFTAFKSLLVGITFSETVINNHILELSDEIIPNKD